MLLRRLGQSARALSIREPPGASNSSNSSNISPAVATTTSTATAAAAAKTMATTTTTPTPNTPSRRRILRGVVFDMDGCLVFSEIDFREMRRRVGAPPGTDILEHVAALPTPQERDAALAAIAEVEHAAIAGMRLAPGALELARELDARRIPRALVTRNVLRSLNHFHALHWIPGGGSNNHNPTPPFHPAITRECGLRHKPHPDALEHIAAQWGVRSSELAMVGDSAFDDVASGRRAGSVTVLIDAQGEYDHEWTDAMEGRDEVPLDEEEDDDKEKVGEEVGVAGQAQGGGGAAGRRKKEPARYLVGERTPHHKVRTLHGVREVLLGGRYDLVGMGEEEWGARQAEARAAAEAAHAAVAADKAGGAASWQALE